MEPKTKRGPSTSEIVGVVLIVAILALSIVSSVPVFNASPEGEQTCASNMKQLGLGLIEYAQDYDQTWPGGADHWAGALYPYIKMSGVYHCPLEPMRNTADRAHACSYVMNGNVRGNSAAALDSPVDTVLLAEADGTPELNMTRAERLSRYIFGAIPNTAWGDVRMGTKAPVLNAPRHDPGVMFLSADGHVQLIRPEKVSSGVDNPSPTGPQDATHAAGTKVLGTKYTLTFSEQ